MEVDVCGVLDDMPPMPPLECVSVSDIYISEADAYVEVDILDI
jgi:hypothetical protein